MDLLGLGVLALALVIAFSGVGYAYAQVPRPRLAAAARNANLPASRNEAIRALVLALRDRANGWDSLARGFMIVTSLLVLLGVIVFLSGDSFLKLIPSREVTIRQRLLVLEKEDIEDTEVGAKLESTGEMLTHTQLAWQSIAMAVRSIRRISSGQDTPGPETDEVQIEQAKRILPEAIKATKNVASRKEQETIDWFNILGATARTTAPTVSEKAWENANDQATVAKLDLSALETSLKASLAALVDKDLNKLNSLQTEQAVSQRDIVLSIEDAIRKQARANAEAVALRRLKSIDRERARQERAKEKQMLQDELKELTKARDDLAMMAWLPGLTIRIGAVIMISFLAGAFLAAFRYMLVLSGFFHARADSLELILASGDGETVNVEQFARLVGQFSPEAIRPESTTLPYDALAGAVRSVAEIRGGGS